MKPAVRLYISLVALGAIVWSVVLYRAQPTLDQGALNAVAILAAFGLIAEALAFLLPNAVTASLGFIPFLAAIIVAPNWSSLAAAVSVKIIVEIFLRHKWPWVLFNAAQHAITVSVAALAFRVLGGQSMLVYKGVALSQITVEIGLPAFAAFAISFAVNSTIIGGIVATNEKRSFAEAWRSTWLSSIGIDVLASPIVFLFAWAFVQWGAFASAALWVPVLGLRHLQKNNLDLERTNSELLELMVKSIEARDPYTSGHSRRVQQFSLAIARGLQLPLREIDVVGRASLLHDVGKIYEKYGPILSKAGKLTAEEWQTMMQHPADGAALVSTMTRLHDIVPAIRHHHERWDGTGYPDGLAGESIPKTSRIIAFADTIDAMVSERPYRRTLTEAEVRAEIVRCRGTQFDPAIADKILSAPIWRLLFAPEPAAAPAVTSLSLTSALDRQRARQA